MENSLEKMVKEKDPQAIQVKELLDFSVKYKLDSKEMTKAYEIALDLEEQESPEAIREEVKTLAEKMKKFINEGLALNRIVELVNQKVDYENAPKEYYAMVSSMPINDKGKKVLKSIVERKRMGSLAIFEEGKKLCEVDISDRVLNGECSQNDLAVELMYILDRFKDKKIEVMFSE